MDWVSLDIMKWSIGKCNIDKSKRWHILDVGSSDVNGTHKVLFNEEPNAVYTGIDIEPGKNVDTVVEPYHWPFVNETFDLVISGSCLEHVEDMYAWVDEVIRVTKKGGYVCLMVPSLWNEHKCPVDCWRIYPDGMRWLFVKRGKMKEIFIGNYQHVEKYKTVTTKIFIDGIDSGKESSIKLRDTDFQYCYGIFKKEE